MQSGSPIPIISDIVAYFGRKRNITSLTFGEDELVKPLAKLDIPWYGAYLNLPTAVAAVITAPEGWQMVYKSGGVINSPPGKYGVHFVDMRQRRTQLPGIQAISSDAWKISMTIELNWQVADPQKIVNTHQPFHTLVNQVKAAVVNFIRSQPHDGLVSAPKVPAIAEMIITQDILRQVRANPALSGFNFINISVLTRQGDPERIQKVHQSMLQKTETQQNLELEVIRLKGELDVMQEKLAVAQKQETLDVQDAHRKSVVALTEAEFTNRVAEILRPVQEQEVEIRQLGESQRLEQERVLEAMKIGGAALSQLAGVLSQMQMTPGLQHGLDNQSFEVLVRLLHSLTENIPAVAVNRPPSPEPPYVLPAVQIRNLGE